MKARWNLDVVRGALLIYPLHGFLQGIGVLWGSFYPYQLAHIGLGVFCAALFAALFLALLFPSRHRLQTVFILFTVGAILPLVSAFWWARNYPDQFSSLSFAFWEEETVHIAAAVAAWFLYRAEPKS